MLQEQTERHANDEPKKMLLGTLNQQISQPIANAKCAWCRWGLCHG